MLAGKFKYLLGLSVADGQCSAGEGNIYYTTMEAEYRTGKLPASLSTPAAAAAFPFAAAAYSSAHPATSRKFEEQLPAVNLSEFTNILFYFLIDLEVLYPSKSSCVC